MYKAFFNPKLIKGGYRNFQLQKWLVPLIRPTSQLVETALLLDMPAEFPTVLRPFIWPSQTCTWRIGRKETSGSVVTTAIAGRPREMNVLPGNN